MSKKIERALEVITSGTEQVTPLKELEEKLKENRPLRIKLGADPTAPDLHLGHAVVLEKMRQFQDLGHEIYFLIGDFTARIGDPTGKSRTRKPLDTEQITGNAQTYLKQVGKILDPKKLQVVYNSHWLKDINLAESIKIMAKVTLAQLITREDFANRQKNKQSIGFHELFYPILQAYDSVHLKADVELGGTDQTFNLLMGRQLQEAYGQKPQVIITLPILEGLDGKQKMSKSLNNYVGLFEDATTAYSKLMSIPDSLMWRYYTLLVGTSKDEINQMKLDVERGITHPMDIKKQMAYTIVSKFWSEQEATAGQKQFEAIFQEKDYTKAKEIRIELNSPCWIVALLKEIKAVESTSQAKRLIESGAIKLDGRVIKDFKADIEWHNNSILQCGKKLVLKLVKR